MKKFAINTTSNLLSALVIGGAVLLAAAPAKAGGDDFAKAVIGIVVLDHILRPHQPQVVHPAPVVTNHYHNNYSVQRCGYQENVFRNGYSTVVEKRNSCTGQLIERRETFN